MLPAAARPTALAGCVLNDIGPVIDPKALMRIKSYVGKLPRVASPAVAVRRAIPEFDRRRLGRLCTPDVQGRRGPHRTRLRCEARQDLARLNPDQPLPPLWKEFDALARVPLLVIRGGHSDILSPTTVAAMQARHPTMEAIEVPDQGHAPLPSDPALIGRIAAFVESCDSRR